MGESREDGFVRSWIFTLLLLAGCHTKYEYLGYGQIIDSTAISEAVIPFAVELEHTSRLRFEDAAVYYDDSIERIRVIFSTQRIDELCPCRYLMVDVVEGLLARFNADPRIYSAFDHYPIVAEDLELYFSYESYYVEYVDPTYIAWMSLHDGLVRYYDGILKDWRKDFWNARIEPYYKAKEFVMIDRKARMEYDRSHPAQKEDIKLQVFE